MIKLFEPRTLTGRYVSKVLQSGHLTSGTMAEALRHAVASHFNVYGTQVVLGSSACACAQVFFDATKPKSVSFCGIPTFVGMYQVARHAGAEIVESLECPKRPQHPELEVGTDIGGLTYHTKAHLNDRCHSWLRLAGDTNTLLSFYPTKLCGGAEGGALICDDESLAEELQCRLNCGTLPLSVGPLRDLSPQYEGRKGNMTDVAAALNLEALEGIKSYREEVRERWENMAASLRERGVPFVAQIEPYLMQVELNAQQQVCRHKICYKLLRRGVLTAHNFPPSPTITIPCPRLATEVRVVADAVQAALNEEVT